ncbi:hypothetical protein FQN57_000872 [Myotisia sp. PD_48]|nr:hypothetical protein FQN57_000872 [Myotisia sp. PD_48]
MDTESPPMQDHDFGGPQWVVDMGTYNAPDHNLQDYGGFAYSTSPIMPVEPAYSMSMPQAYTSQHLLPLTMSPHWPNMLSTQPSYAPLSVAPMHMHHVTSSLPHIHPSPVMPPTPRRTLTEDDRRRMCKYHHENPHVKQTEIGAMFGVERSTVSKVLRQKEKYLFPEDDRRSPVKRLSKGKFPDIERALSNWVRNHQRQGGELNDEIIREKALFFASTVGSQDGHEKIQSSSWLEKFKQKNCLSSGVPRKGSVDVTKNLESTGNSSASQTPNQFSPVSPTATPSPVSPKPSRSGWERESLSGIPEHASGGYIAPTSPNSTSMKPSPLSTNDSTVIFKSENPFSPSAHSGLGVDQNRPRSQTLPILSTESPMMKPDPAEGLSPKNSFYRLNSCPGDREVTGASPSTSNQPTPESDVNATPMHPPPIPKSKSVSSANFSAPPTQDEVRCALELVVNYFEHQPLKLAAQDYMIFGKLMERLELVQKQAPGSPATKLAHRINDPHDGPRVSKKRSIHTL